MYVAFVVDVYGRTIVGWAAPTNKRTALVLNALETGLWRGDREGRPAGHGLVHHSDTGSPSTRLSGSSPTWPIAASIGTVGDAYDDAPMESTIGLYKTELIHCRDPWKAHAQVELAAAE